MIVPAQYNFQLFQGADFGRVFKRLDSSGNPIAFTGYTPRIVAKVKYSDTDTVFNYSGSPYLVFDGSWNLTLTLTANETDLAPCCLVYSISLINNSNANDIIAYADGAIEVIKRADAGV